MKWYVADFNGILTDLCKQVKVNLSTPRDADVWVIWQDCQGSYKDLIKTAQELGVSKPTYVVQHGRAATQDYDAPNSFKLLADKFLCWGKADYDRLTRLGYGNKAHIVGCPLNSYIKPRVLHREKIVLFVPVNTGKEEPENIAAYYELLKMRYSHAQVFVLQNKEQLKNKWGFNNKLNTHFTELSRSFDVAAKLLPWHDKNLYHGNVTLGYQDSFKNNELVFNLLRNVDLVVGIDEGTTEIFAYGHDVPVVIVDGFKYRAHGKDGKPFASTDPYRTKASTHVTLDKLQEAVEYGLAHPEHLRRERAEVAEAELGISYGNATDNIFKLIRNDFSLRSTCAR